MRQLRIFLLIALVLIIGTSIYLHFHRKLPTDEIVLFGNVDVRQVDIGFRVNGRVITMPFEEGDLVPQGVLMATLDKQPYADQVFQAAAAVESAKISLENAELLLKRREELVGGGGVSREDYENALTSRNVWKANLTEAIAALGVAAKNLSDTEVYSPIEGTILTRIREPGSVVRESDPVYTLSILSPVWVRTFISEPNLGRIYPGMEADIFTDTRGGKVYRGRVGFISPVAEFTPKTVETTELRTDLVYRLRVTAENPDSGLRQGMPVTVKLYLKERDGKENQ